MNNQHQGVCPNCGYCPTCGRRNPSYPYWVPYPIYPTVPYTSPVTPNITYTSGSWTILTDSCPNPHD